MSSTERQATGLRGGPVNDRLQVIALLLLTAVTAVLAIIVLVGLFEDDQPQAVDAEGDRTVTSPGSDPDSSGGPGTVAGSSLPRVVFIGDEWAQGAGATGADRAFPALAASELGWTFDIDAVAGSGWTKDSPDVPNSRFVDRAARLSDGENAADVVVFSAQTPSGSPLREVGEAITETVAAVRAEVPDAVTVIVLPVANAEADVLCPPAADDLICIDTFAEEWLTPGDRAPLMNARVGAPNNAGHARLAGLLAKDLRSALPQLAR